MFDFAHNLKLAVSDRVKGVGLKAAGGVIAAVAAGFLIAALWAFLAHELGWGSALASLAIAVLLLAVAAILFVVSKPKHRMPTTDDLKREVEARVTLASNAAADRARAEAARVMDMAENKAHSLMDQVSYRATKLADDAERKVFGTVRQGAVAMGLTSENVRDVKHQAAHGQAAVSRAANSNAGSMAKLLGAFAVGVTLAAKLSERRDDDEDDYDYEFDLDDMI